MYHVVGITTHRIVGNIPSQNLLNSSNFRALQPPVVELGLDKINLLIHSSCIHVSMSYSFRKCTRLRGIVRLDSDASQDPLDIWHQVITVTVSFLSLYLPGPSQSHSLSSSQAAIHLVHLLSLKQQEPLPSHHLYFPSSVSLDYSRPAARTAAQQTYHSS